MILVILTALTAVCGAAKLDRGYLPPITAKTAGGSPGALQAPFDGLPTGSYTNDAQGVVVDAVNPGTRTSGLEPTGLGGPRTAYGSTNSKVGEAAFKGSANGAGSINPLTRIAPGFESLVASDESDQTRATSLKFSTDVTSDNYSYGFETDNGISVGEDGVAANGVQAQGGYSYKGDDGQTYSVTYTADEGGYRPKGQHLPTPPPIPDEILKSLEKNAKEEAAGHVDDGSYDAQKYNDEGDYSSNKASNNNGRPLTGSGATASGSFVSQSNQAYRPTSGVLIGTYNGVAGSETQGNTGFGQGFGNKQSGFGSNKDQVGVTAQGANSNFESQGQFGNKNQFSTENRFKDTASGSGQSFSHSHASASSSPDGPNFHSLPGSSKINTAYSSAVTTGSGSASAFASSGPVGAGFKNDYLSASNNFGYDSSAGASIPEFSAVNPSTASASASVSGLPTFGHSQQFGSSQQGVPTPTGSLSFGGANNVPTSSQSSFGSSTYSQGHASGLGNEYLPPVNTFGSTSKVTHSHSHGADSLTGASSPDFHTHSQSPNVPSIASASSSVIGNQGSQLVQNTNNFPSRLGETQTSQFTSSGSSLVKPVSSFSSQTQSGNSVSSSEYLPPVNIIESTGKPTYHSHPQGTDSFSAASSASNQFGHQQSGLSPTPATSGSFGVSSHQTGQHSQTFNSKPGQYSQTNSGLSSSGHSQFGNTNTHFSGIQPTQPSLGVESLPGQGPTKTPDTELTTPFESNYQSTSQGGNSLSSSSIPIPSPTPISTFVSPVQSQSGIYQSQSAFNNQVTSQYKPQLQGSVKPTDAAFASSAQRPSLTQEQGSDDSYYYKQPSKPFITPTTSVEGSSDNKFTINNRQPNFPVSSLTQQGSKYSNIPSKPTTSPYGVTQAAVSSFSSSSSTPSTLLQTSQFGSKPTTSTQFAQSSQFGQQASTQFGATGSQDSFGQKLTGQTQYGQTTSGISAQQYQGAVYEYNKPAGTVPASQQSTPFGQTQITTQGKPSQVSTGSKFGSQQGSSQFGSQSKPIGSTTIDSSVQSTQIAQTATSQLGLKPNTNQGVFSTSSSQGQNTQTTQIGQKPFGTQTTGTKYQSTQFGVSGSQFGASNTQFNQKPQTTQGTNRFSSTSQSQAQQSQFGTKPSGVQSGSYFQQTQFGTTGQKTGSTQGTGLTSTSSTFGQKPFGSTTTGSSFQQSQFGLPGSQFGQKPQTSQGSSFTSNTFSQGQTSQFGKQPIGSTYQQTQFGSQFGQKQQSTASTGVTGINSQASFGQKPFGGSQTGSTFQQSQFSSKGSTFGQKPQKGIDSSLSSTTSQTSFVQKPVSASQTGYTYQKPQTTGTAFGSSTISKGQQTTLFGQKPLSSSQTTGSNFQQTQFSSSTGSQPTGIGSVVGTSSQNQYGQASQFGQKPFGTTVSSYQQTQLGTTGSQFDQKPQSSQGSAFAFSTATKGQTGTAQGTGLTSTSGQKPFGSVTTGSSIQQSQYGSSGFQLGQKPIGPSQTTGSNFQQSQYASSSGSQLSTQGAGSDLGSNVNQFGQTSFGNKPFGTSSTTGSSFQQTQFSSSSGSKFNQIPQTVQGTFSQTQQGNQFGSKPQSSVQTTQGSTFQQSQLGQKQQTYVPTITTISETVKPFEQKPFSSSQTGSSFQIGLSGFQSTQKPTSTFGTYSQSSQFGTQTKQPSGSSQTGSSFQSGSSGFQTTQKPSSTFGTYSQSSQFGTQTKQPSGSSQTGSSFQIGSSGFQTTQKPTSAFGTYSQSSQFGAQTKKPSGSSQTGSSFQIGSSGFQTTQKPSSTFGTYSQSSQFGTQTKQPSGSSQTGSSFQSGSSGFQTTQKPTSAFGTYSQSSQFGTQTKQPFGSSQTNQFGSTTSQFSQKPQAQASAFASSSGSNVGQPIVTEVKPVGNSQVSQVSKYQQTSQFGSQNQGVVSSTQKPFGSLSTQNNYQSQYSQSSNQFGTPSRFSQGSESNVGSGLPVGQTSFSTQTQKPFGSQFTQTSYQQSQTNNGQKPFGGSQGLGSTFQTGQSIRDQKTQPTQSNVQTTSFTSQNQNSFGNDQGYNYQKPEVTFNAVSQFGQDQKTQPSQTSFSTQQSVLGQANVQKVKPFGSSSTGSYQGQSNIGSQTGLQSTIATGLNGQLSGQPFKPASTASTESKYQSQSSVVSTGQFGVQPTKPTIGYNGQPFQSVSSTPAPSFGSQNLVGSTPQFGVQPTQSSIIVTSQKPSLTQFGGESLSSSGFSSTQAPEVPSRLGSNVVIPISSIDYQGNFEGKGEEFGGPRDPPRFDDKTGYHY